MIAEDEGTTDAKVILLSAASPSLPACWVSIKFGLYPCSHTDDCKDAVESGSRFNYIIFYFFK